MICSVIGDLTETLAQHDNCDHFGARKQFYLGFSKQLQNWGHQNTPPVPWAAQPTHHWTETDAWWKLELASYSLSRALDNKTRAGRLRGGNELGQILNFSDFDNIGDSNTLLTRGLSKNRGLDTRHTKPSFRGNPSIPRANQDNIIRPF